jgi:hypothetical protein
VRGPALPASPQAVARVLHEAGYQTEEGPTRPHTPPVRHFERARHDQLRQTDLFTFVLKRHNRRVYCCGDRQRKMATYAEMSFRDPLLNIRVYFLQNKPHSKSSTSKNRKNTVGFVGLQPLAKNYDVCPLYRLTTRGDPSPRE